MGCEGIVGYGMRWLGRRGKESGAEECRVERMCSRGEER